MDIIQNSDATTQLRRMTISEQFIQDFYFDIYQNFEIQLTKERELSQYSKRRRKLKEEVRLLKEIQENINSQ